MIELDILNGFVGKVISDCVDITINAIKKADKNRKCKNQSIETRIYQVTIDVLNNLPENEYKETEKVYDAAESILKRFKNSKGDYKEDVRMGLKLLIPQVTGDTCDRFLNALRWEISKENNRDLAIERIISQQGQIARDMHERFEDNSRNHEETHRRLDCVMERLDSLEKDRNQQEGYKAEPHEEPKRNKAQDYADKWHDNVFLNDFKDEDEVVGVNITLDNLYKEVCLPRYIWKKNSEPSQSTLRELLEKYIIDNQNGKMLLILGQPGIGKSTLITWIMNNLADQKKEIFVYQFATDLKDTNWQGEDILEEIIKTLCLKSEELKNKILILDGFDEIHTDSGRERILNKLSKEIDGKRVLGHFSLIITCRENYVDCSHLSVEHYITLQAWNKKQIRDFCDIYAENIGIENNTISEKKINKIIENKEIFGIPLILYMVLALNITIEESDSIVDIYDRIFSLEGGAIYDRCYDEEHRINSFEIKKHIYRISQKIAFWMFENKADEAVISQKRFEEICEYEMNESGKSGEEIERDTLIGNFFKLKHCEGKETPTIQFVHRSIYEYFVTIYFFESIHNLKSIEEVAGKLGELLKKGHLSEQILEFIKYKFGELKYCNLLDQTKNILNLMLRDGMTHHYIKNQEESFLNIMEWEMNILSNMLDVVHLWNSQLGKVDDRIICYLKDCQPFALNLRGINWEKANLNGANLRGADLEKANLKKADLREADLREADLKEADLKEADLTQANLKEADLREADLREANLREVDLRKANLERANLEEVHLEEASLKEADLRKADLRKADLTQADLRETDLREANLGGADFRDAGMRGVDLREADLEETYLSKTDLREANLEGTDLKNAYLVEACIQGAIFDEKQVDILLKKCDIRGIRIYIPELMGTISYEEYCFENGLNKNSRRFLSIVFERILSLFRLGR